MKNKVLFLILITLSIFFVANVNAEGKVKLNLECPQTAKINTQIKCTLYGKSEGSSVATADEITVSPSGAIKQATYLLDYRRIELDEEKELGTITVVTNKNAGIGELKVTLANITFEDETTQNKVEITKKISITKTGETPANTNSNTTNNTTNQTTTDTTLKGITISSGTLSPVFKADVYNYTVKVDKNVDKITIQGVKNNQNQKITGEVINQALKYGENKFALVVANSQNKTKTYNITVEREDARDTNAYLSSLSLSEGEIVFSPNTFEYQTKVLYEVEEINVLATPEKQTSTVTVEGNKNLKVGENKIIITVKSEKETTQKYTITVTRLNEGETLGNSAAIKNITVEGYDLKFNYEVTKYKLLIKNEKKLTINVTMEDPNASYKIEGNNNLKDGNIIKIITTSFDGKESKTYIIEITKTSYTIYYVIGAATLAFLILIPSVICYRYIKQKKKPLDVNGFIVGSPEDQTNYRTNIMTNEPQKQEPNISRELSNVKCPHCGRELLGTPDICPYCNNKLM